MEQLIKQAIIDKINKKRPKNLPELPWVPLLVSYSVASCSFDLVDSKDGVYPIKAEYKGVVNYSNPQRRDIHIVDYDAFFKSIYDHYYPYDQQNYVREIRRCDFIAFDTGGTDEYFIFNELCEGDYFAKESDGIEEMASSLEFLYQNLSKNTAILNRKIRRCYLSVKDIKIVSPMKMADAFGLPSNLLPSTYQLRKDNRIRKRGFDLYASRIIVWNGKPIPNILPSLKKVKRNDRLKRNI